MTIEDTNTPRWNRARAMCQSYGYDVREIAERLARFRAIRDRYAECKPLEVVRCENELVLTRRAV